MMSMTYRVSRTQSQSQNRMGEWKCEVEDLERENLERENLKRQNLERLP